MTAERPRMTRILIMLLPTTFPKLNPEFPETAERTFTTSSGEEVPNATMVSPITRLEIFFFLATAEAPLTSQLAPKINGINPMTENNRLSILLNVHAQKYRNPLTIL